MRNILYNTIAKITIWKKNTIHNSLERYEKTVYSEICVRQKVLRQSVFTAKCPYLEKSVRRSVREVKSHTAKIPVTGWIAANVIVGTSTTATAPSLMLCLLPSRKLLWVFFRLFYSAFFFFFCNILFTFNQVRSDVISRHHPWLTSCAESLFSPYSTGYSTA